MPVLFVNGEADPQNRPENVAAAGEHYPASRALVAPGQSVPPAPVTHYPP